MALWTPDMKHAHPPPRKGDHHLLYFILGGLFALAGLLISVMV